MTLRPRALAHFRSVPATQRELHRRAYNASFQHFKLAIDGAQVDWSVEYFDILANTVGGGKPKMKYHFGENGWPTTPEFFGGAVPSTEDEQNALVDALQDKKTEFYKEIVETTATARPGVLRLMDEAIADPSIAVGICSAATKAGFEKVVNSVVGPERLGKMDVIMAGDDVTRKKPDPLIYNLARERVDLPGPSVWWWRIPSSALRRRSAPTCRASSRRARRRTCRTSWRRGAKAVMDDGKSWATGTG